MQVVGFYCFYISVKIVCLLSKEKSQRSIKYEFTMPLFDEILSENYKHSSYTCFLLIRGYSVEEQLQQKLL